MKSPRFWTLVLLMLCTFALLRVRGDVDRIPPSVPLNQFPSVITAWTSQEIPLDQEVLDVLGKGFFLNRVYAKESVTGASTGVPIQLFIGYFPTQRTGQSIHSPQNCLPGAGWTFDASGVTELRDQTGRTYRVGEYVISNGKARQEVLYWYRSHGQTIANDYMAKLYMLATSIRYNRTDAALVRVITPILPEESQSTAHQRVISFAEQVTPLLPAYIPN